MKILILLLCFLSIPVYALQLGIEQYQQYLPQLSKKNVGLVVNQSSRLQNVHLIDFLLKKRIQVKKLFALEHGLRGNLDPGETVEDGIDDQTGLPIISLYGKNKKPTAEHLKDLDIILFDVQDVGVRFYTYLSSMHYIMESSAQNNVSFMILDRPNPNDDYIAGPVLKMSHQSFLGMHPIPLVHAMTLGELALMIKGEGWIKQADRLSIKVIKMNDYRHGENKYRLAVAPSPNLPNHHSLRWYPTLALFEPTTISIGRGTYYPFQVIGHPQLKNKSFSYRPVSIPGMSKKPKHENKLCYGEDLRNVKPPQFTVSFLKKYLTLLTNKKEKFWQYERFFDFLIGNGTFRTDIQTMSVTELTNKWQKDLKKFKLMRSKYLLYPEYE
jgi:uncharacterized protein YbbC (DUF1343 family)